MTCHARMTSVDDTGPALFRRGEQPQQRHIEITANIGDRLSDRLPVFAERLRQISGRCEMTEPERARGYIQAFLVVKLRGQVLSGERGA